MMTKEFKIFLRVLVFALILLAFFIFKGNKRVPLEPHYKSAAFIFVAKSSFSVSFSYEARG